MAMVYGIGGIGMTTMPANALMLHTLMALTRELTEGRLTLAAEFRRRIETSDFGPKIPNLNERNPFDRNYSSFVDFIDEPKIIRNKLKTEFDHQIAKNDDKAKVTHSSGDGYC